MIINTSDFDRVLGKKRLAYQTGVRLGVGDIVSQITARADELVPFDTGVLSGSQTVKPTGKGAIIEVEIGYGGPAAPYALVQHEDESLSHPPKAKGGSPVAPGRGRGPKYLEYPTRVIGKRAEAIIAANVKKAGG